MRQLVALLAGTLILACAARCEASRPVRVASQGCVLGGRIYVIHDARTVYRYELSRPMDLRRYEGKLVWLEGSLLPGDRFTPRSGRLRIVGRITRQVRELVARHESIFDIAPDEVRVPAGADDRRR